MKKQHFRDGTWVKTFNGRLFVFHTSEHYKDDAEEIKNDLRRRGYRVRVFKYQGDYVIFRSERKIGQ